MKRLTNRRTRTQIGHAMMELALMVPALTLFVFGAGDFGRVFYASMEVANASAAGAIYGSQTVGTAKNADKMKEAAMNEAQDLNASLLSVSASEFCQCPDKTSVSCGGSCVSGKVRTYVSVTASYPFTPLVKYPGIPPQTTITKTSVMRVQ